MIRIFVLVVVSMIPVIMRVRVCMFVIVVLMRGAEYIVVGMDEFLRMRVCQNGCRQRRRP